MTNLTFERIGNLEVATLNRPEVLNALNAEMVEALAGALEGFRRDQALRAILIKGAGNRAFCAGGDIKFARLGAIAVKEGKMALKDVVQFFVEEYALNKSLFHFEIPTISFMNGITMGGGVGVAGPCKYRIATEKTVWAMPEVSIGFFPDVGAAYYLSRAPGYVGRYLALTGAHIANPADLIKCGFATHFIPLEEEERLTAELAHGEVQDVLDAYSQDAGKTGLPYELIDQCFDGASVEEILAKLDGEGGAWALETVALIRAKAPISLKVALRHVDKAKTESFDEVIARDLQFAGKFLDADDLIEGVRAVVVDKDKSPKWNPSSLDLVSETLIDGYFN